MPVAEWENIDSIVSPIGQLILNDIGNVHGFGYYLTAKEGADSGSDVRATRQGVPQGAGSIVHRGFPDGWGMKMPIQYWVSEGVSACSTSSPTAQQMDDLLMRHVRAMLDGGGRVFYTPEGMAVRLLDQVSNVEKSPLTEEAGLTGTVVVFASPFPYMIDFDQTLTTLTAGSPTATLTNTGSAPFFPVFKVYGTFDDFVLANTTTGEQIAYDDSQPGASVVTAPDYIEIDTFRNTVYLNGNGAPRKAGIVIPTSDFFTLEVGDNDLEITSAGTAPNVDVLWASAWY
jgi:hypothetical protein